MQRLHRSEEHPILSAADLLLSFISHIADSLLLEMCYQHVLVRTEQNLTYLKPTLCSPSPKAEALAAKCLEQ